MHSHFLVENNFPSDLDEKDLIRCGVMMRRSCTLSYSFLLLVLCLIQLCLVQVCLGTSEPKGKSK